MLFDDGVDLVGYEARKRQVGGTQVHDEAPPHASSASLVVLIGGVPGLESFLLLRGAASQRFVEGHLVDWARTDAVAFAFPLGDHPVGYAQMFGELAATHAPRLAKSTD